MLVSKLGAAAGLSECRVQRAIPYGQVTSLHIKDAGLEPVLGDLCGQASLVMGTDELTAFA